MALHRMFFKDLVFSHGFMHLSKDAQLLWFRLNLTADDDGFFSSAGKAMSLCGIEENAFNELKNNDYIIGFPSGAYLIRHWVVNNCVPKDRYKPTEFQGEFSHVIGERDENGKVKGNDPYILDTECIQDVSKLDTKEKESKEKEKEKEKEKKVNDFETFLNDLLNTFNNETESESGIKDIDPKTKQSIKGHYQNGHTLKDFTLVIRDRKSEWEKDKKMKQYIRPSTLFGAKFEEYLMNATENEKDKHKYDIYD